MNKLFVANEKESAVDTVVNRIKQLLLENKLHLGDKLPNELEISEGLCVSRGSVREAMKILAALGVVEVKVGNGTYIVDKPKDTLIDPLLFSFFLINPELTELSEFRKLFETDIIKLIISHYHENEKERMLIKENVNSLKELQIAKASPDILTKNDMEFHSLLGEACHNSLAKKIYSFVMVFFKNSILNSHKHQQSGHIALESHIAILNAIEAQDIDLIKNAIEVSVDYWKDLQFDDK
ncbi:MAG: GntR family transcriptional regulator [Herbinix sp.]|nr:GntR family transcriptional regulator [Herbinix sp.]